MFHCASPMQTDMPQNPQNEIQSLGIYMFPDKHHGSLDYMDISERTRFTVPRKKEVITVCTEVDLVLLETV